MNAISTANRAASPRGIGLATARMFAKHGARVAILDLDGDAAAAAAASEKNHVPGPPGNAVLLSAS